MECQTTKFLSDFKILKKQTIAAHAAIDKHEQALYKASESLREMLTNIQEHAQEIMSIINHPERYHRDSIDDIAYAIDGMIDECKKVLPLEYWDE